MLSARAAPPAPQYFKEIFCNTVRAAEKSEPLAKRLDILVTAITRAMFIMICRGIFEKHKGLFAFLIAISIQRCAGKITPDEWAACVYGRPLHDALARARDDDDEEDEDEEEEDGEDASQAPWAEGLG